MNISVDDIEKGIHDIVKQPDGIRRLAEVIHLILSDMESTAMNTKKAVIVINQHKDN